MLGCVVVFLAAGWRAGGAFPGGATLLAASGAAFSAVVVGQAGNAFACRSTGRTPFALGWTSNRLLLSAVAVEVAALAGFLFIGPVARLLRQAPPPLWGTVVALFAAPAVLGADALHKWLRRRAGRAQGRRT